MPKTDTKPQGWTEAALNAVIGWFPDLPQWVRIIFASATIYLVLCLVAQVSPVALFTAAQGEFQAWVSDGRAVAAEHRASEARERADVIELLREQNREYREQITPADPALVRRVVELEYRMQLLRRDLDALLIAHPKARERARAPEP